MRAFMSQGSHGPVNDHRAKAYVQAIETAPYNVNCWEVVTVLEARILLSETEAQEVHSFGNAAFHVSLTSLNRDYLDDGAEETLALAESLARFIALEIS